MFVCVRSFLRTAILIVLDRWSVLIGRSLSDDVPAICSIALCLHVLVEVLPVSPARLLFVSFGLFVVPQ